MTINELSSVAYIENVQIDGGVEINGSVSINQANGGFEDIVSIFNMTISGNLGIQQTSAGEADSVNIQNTSVTGNVSINQAAASNDEIEVNEGVIIRGNISINQSSANFNEVEIDTNTSVSGRVSITDSPAENQFYLDTQSQIGGLTLNFGAGHNVVVIYAATIEGTAVLNLGVSGVGYNEIQLGSHLGTFGTSTSLLGQVTVNMGDGTNSVYLGQDETTDFGSNLSNTFTANSSSSTSLTEGYGLTGDVPTFKNF